MKRHAEKCVERYCEVVMEVLSPLQLVGTTCMYDHLIRRENFETQGELSLECAQIAFKSVYLAKQIYVGQCKPWQDQSQNGRKKWKMVTLPQHPNKSHQCVMRVEYLQVSSPLFEMTHGLIKCSAHECTCDQVSRSDKCVRRHKTGSALKMMGIMHDFFLTRASTR